MQIVHRHDESATVVPRPVPDMTVGGKLTADLVRYFLIIPDFHSFLCVFLIPYSFDLQHSLDGSDVQNG